MSNLAAFSSGEWPPQTTAAISDLVANTISPEEAAKALECYAISEEDVENGISEEDVQDSTSEVGVEDRIEAIWAVVLAAAREFPLIAHDRLVELLFSISSLPSPRDRSGALFFVYSKPLDWRDMPGLGMSMNEEWNGFGGPDPEGEYRIDYLSLSDAIDLWLKINHFAALLMKRSPSIFPFSLFCLWSFSRKGIEHPVNGGRDSDRLKWAVPGAAIWITLLGDRIYGYREEFPGTSSSNPGSGGPLWYGTHGFSLGRWQLWKLQFDEIAAATALDDETKLVAAEARDKMVEVEQNGLAANRG